MSRGNLIPKIELNVSEPPWASHSRPAAAAGLGRRFPHFWYFENKGGLFHLSSNIAAKKMNLENALRPTEVKLLSNPPMSWRICYFPLISNAVAFHTVILWKTWLRSGRCWRIVCTILEFELHLTDKCFRDATLLNFSQQLCAFGRLPKSCWKSFGWRKKFTGMNFAVCESTKFNVLASGSFVIFVSNFCNTYSDIPPPRRWTIRQIRQ